LPSESLFDAIKHLHFDLQWFIKAVYKKYFQKITKKERFYLTVKYNRIYYM